MKSIELNEVAQKKIVVFDTIVDDVVPISITICAKYTCSGVSSCFVVKNV